MAARGRPSNKAREEEIAKTLGPERVPENQKREIYERVRRAVDAKNGICTSLKVGASAWDKHERKVLEEGLRYFPHDRHSNMSIYIRIAASLPKKTTRDVAHYLRQMQDAHRAKLEAAVGMNAAKPHHPDPATAAAMVAMHEHQMAAMFAANAASMAPMPTPPGMAQGLSGPEGPGPHLKDEKVEARVCALLQENMGLIGSIRENIMMGRFFDNHSLMITFDKNIKEITAMLEALPTADIQKLPVQVNPYFITGSLPTGMGALQPPGALHPPGSLTHQPLAHRYFSAARGDDRNERRTGGAAVGIVDASAAPNTSACGKQMVSPALLQHPPQLWPFVAPASQPQTLQAVPQAADVLAAAEATFSAAAAAIANVQTGGEVEVVPTTEEGKVVAPEPAEAEPESTVQTAPTQDAQV